MDNTRFVPGVRIRLRGLLAPTLTARGQLVLSSCPPEFAARLERSEIAACQDLYRAAGPQVSRDCGARHQVTGGALVLMARGVDLPAFNRVLGLGIAQPATEAALDGVIDRFDKAGIPRFAVQVGPTAGPPALAEWLRARKFESQSHWLRLHRPAVPAVVRGIPVRVEQIGPGQAEAFGRCMVTACSWPDALVPWLARTVGLPAWRHYLAFDGDTPVGTAALAVHQRIGWFGFASTLPAWQGQGVQSALIVRRINDAVAAGCTDLSVETADDPPLAESPSSARNLRRQGFRVAYLRANWIRRT